MRPTRVPKLMFPLLVLVASLTGVLAPKQGDAALRVCNYYCLDPELACCITCYWQGSSCVCPDSCVIGPEL